ncbi:hypothetical protein A2116_01355 [Candidatus Jorgensenbacteria bacterium GWA1_49_17]|uniref:Metallo-beta-lactamase domain-containing protein n=2 Tax=Candidatus Joergenseniibacteriota TaxID=1752739 RepID=A0A1F6BMQ6_9BACT|nr:MAG: hypothetical protein A2127_00815 [Candidatus Jorgensenbacteria bacterium GWC1_48_12]OGG39842.1 MAG: hypothetical protein A2116_01355 [Candidatus Jorgensenbacteria bacterium GWA1_49_17]
MSGHKNKIIVIGAVSAVFCFSVLWQVFTPASGDLEIYFLDVGQGDSEFVKLPGGTDILIDGGPPNGRALNELARALERGDRYIDLVILSHPQLDHFGGLVEVLKRYKVGVFIWNGAETDSDAFAELKETLRENGIPEVILGAGDKIKAGGSEIIVISPDDELLKAKDLNDTSLVLELVSGNSKTLFTGDASAAVLENLRSGDLDILKVAHHGSKFSSSAEFLKAVKPEAAVVEVGRNSYGHPTYEALEALRSAGAQIFRTDVDGTLKFTIDGEDIKIFKDLW